MTSETKISGGTYKVMTGPEINGHLFRADELYEAVRVLVNAYQEITGLDVHPAEATLHESRQLRRGSLEVTGPPVIEVHVGGRRIASLREVFGAESSAARAEVAR